MENLINAYLQTKPGGYRSLVIDSTVSPIFLGGFDIEKLTHEELSSLGWLLTRETQMTINRDHFSFWSWCVNVIEYCRVDGSIPVSSWIRQDLDLKDGLVNLVNLLIAPSYSTDLLRKTNAHVENIIRCAYMIAGPLSFAVLEGLIRRKNSHYLDKAGVVYNPFPEYDYTGKKIGTQGIKGRKGSPNRINRIHIPLRLFEYNTSITIRQRPCIGLGEIKNEIQKQYSLSNKDAFNLIDEWRNDLVHGNSYWQKIVSIILNLICLLFIDEIDSQSYTKFLPQFQHFAEWNKTNLYSAKDTIYPFEGYISMS